MRGVWVALLLMAVCQTAMSQCPAGLKCRPIDRFPTAQTTVNPLPGCFNASPPVPPKMWWYQDWGMYSAMLAQSDIQLVKMEVTIQVRFLALSVIASWNAVTPWHPTALPFYYANGYGVPFKKHVLSANKTQNIVERNIAIGYAYHRLSEALLPETYQYTSRLLTTFGFDPEYRGNVDFTKPADIGNAVAKAMIALTLGGNDGWNEDGNSRYNRFGVKLPAQFGDDMFATNWSDFSYGSTTPNDAYTMRDIKKWQPLLETNKAGYYFIQTHLTPQAGWAKPFFLTQQQVSQQFILSTPPWNTTTMDAAGLAYYKDQTDQVIQASASLTEDQKLMSEHFDFKPNAFGAALYGWYLTRYKWDQTMALAYDLSIPVLADAISVAWRNKITHMAVRPVSSIRYLYGNTNITAYRGPGLGSGPMPGSKFTSYLRTMPHSDYPSATACLCSAFAEFNQLFIGNDNFDYIIDKVPGCSSREPGMIPKAYDRITLTTKADFLNACANSRLWAGVHYPMSIDAGVKLCKDIGSIGYQKVMGILKGNTNKVYPPKAWAT